MVSLLAAEKGGNSEISLPVSLYPIPYKDNFLTWFCCVRVSIHLFPIFQKKHQLRGIRAWIFDFGAVVFFPDNDFCSSVPYAALNLCCCALLKLRFSFAIKGKIEHFKWTVK